MQKLPNIMTQNASEMFLGVSGEALLTIVGKTASW